ncbi:ATP synthase subunit I [Bacillus sp. ISL-51]|uniref:ATP synthase subunit I n=1 Tax=Bacteria TaxID=2 RepID=UPI001BE5A886|nr:MULTISPECIES: ATP synthase subunit I [Bacteria]MBT2573017.1 ATP synthase subunit I [Bacillus sp. ISL-51]MBT2635259.1 ATP synthase subunit I [Bacillus sp. ISL-26]MBT2713491.1 ATP synthase subunit I [Pseudomonas sp. ISL-88]MBY8911716.1 ATP synthase subunit I [Bacillus sp. YC2]
MDDPNLTFRRQRRYVFVILAIYLLGYGFTAYKTIFLGLILGTVFSLFNLWLLIRRMNAFDKAAAKGKSIRSLGSAARWCNAILAMAIAFKYPGQVSVASVIIGLMTIYPVIMIDSIIQLKRSSMEER